MHRGSASTAARYLRQAIALLDAAGRDATGRGGHAEAAAALSAEARAKMRLNLSAALTKQREHKEALAHAQAAVALLSAPQADGPAVGHDGSQSARLPRVGAQAASEHAVHEGNDWTDGQMAGGDGSTSARGVPRLPDAPPGAESGDGITDVDRAALLAIAFHDCCCCHEYLGQPSHAKLAASRALRVANKALPADDRLRRRLERVMESYCDAT